MPAALSLEQGMGANGLQIATDYGVVDV